MKKYFVSVVIPVYNAESTLRLCLQAIKNLKTTPDEIIVVDDSSTDKSKEIIKEFKVTLIELKENSGPAKARNIGVDSAYGDIIFFIDADLAVHPDSLTIMLERINEDKNIIAVVGAYSKVPLKEGNCLMQYKILQEHYWKVSTPGLISSFPCSISIIKKNIFKEFSGFDEKYKKADVEDIDLGNKISKKYKIFMEPQAQGRHDSDSSLSQILSNISKRACFRVELFLKRKKLDNHYVTSGRVFASIFSSIALISFISSLFLFLFTNTNLQIIFFIFITGILSFLFFILSDLCMYIFAFKEKGIRFILFFIFVHFCVSNSVIYGVSKGFIKIIIKKLYKMF